mgnify:CR=1 FL=1
MVKYLKGVIEAFPEQIVGKSATLAGDRLFDIRDKKDRKLLEEEIAVALLLFVIMAAVINNIIE